ncbi:hypothetical protein HK102_009137, partial [Quaeritorhiza haematococci]
MPAPTANNVQDSQSASLPDTAAEDYDILLKILLVGDTSVGKSNLLSRFAKNTFTPELNPESDFESEERILKVDGKNIKAQVWDYPTARESFQELAGP